MSRRVLTAILHKMGYDYKRMNGEYGRVDETADLKKLRMEYLDKIAEIRREGQYVIYLDESYVNHHHVSNFCWVKDGDKVRLPSGKGDRWIMFHGLGIDGWVSGAEQIFRAKKSGDYHNSMNAKHFLEMFENMCAIANRLYGRCAMVIDNAAYHVTMADESSKISFWRNMGAAELKQMWREGNVPGCQGKELITITKKAMLPIIKQNLTPGKLRVQEIAQKHGCTVVRLPPYHPDLTAIEPAWGVVKNHVAQINYSKGISFQTVKSFIIDGMNKVTTKTSKDLFEKVQRKKICIGLLWKKREESEKGPG